MPNIIKYSLSSSANSIKSGNFNVAVNNTATDLTGFYTGICPIIGGYTIYIDKASGGPSIYAPKNDTQLIEITNNLGGNVLTADAALVWINSQSNMTVLNNNYPSIVTSGLTLNLDAGFVSSYPKTGTSWKDLSGNGNNGTLVNGPTYSSAGGGCIVSDGSDDGVTVVDSSNLDLTKFTLDGWVWFNQHKDYGSLLVKGPGGNGSLFNYCFFFYASTIICGFGDGGNFYAAPILAPPINTWHHIVGVYDSVAISFYLNGVLTQSIPVVATPYQNNNSLNIIQTEYPIDGKVSSAKVYNRALSASEVLQNYYAGLQKLIPTDGLVLSLDAQNTNLYAVSLTTGYDVSGNDNNGVLTNGVQYIGDGNGSWSFDGVDDKIQTTLNALASSTTWTVWVKRTESINTYNMIMGMYLPYFSSMSDGSIHFSNNIGGAQRSLYAYVGLVNNVWYFMTFVSSFSAGNTTMMIYLNGILQTQVTYSGQQPTTTNNSFRLGGWEDGGSYPFRGNISNASIYNRVLTQTEITTIYNSTKSRYGL
jgi:hypothetical protein